jgi:hypothetical protein
MYTGESCKGLAQIVGQLWGSNRDFQSKCWAKSRNLLIWANPAIFLLFFASGCVEVTRRWACTPAGGSGLLSSIDARGQ